MKRMIAGLLALILVAGLIPASAFAAGETEVTLSNAYMEYTLNTETGAFMIGTAAGHPQKAGDDNMPLLYDGGAQTSYATVRIDGEDYVFGKSYGFLGIESSLAQPVLDQGNQTISIKWTIKGIEVTQFAELKSDAVNPLSGNVGLRYTVKNVSAAAGTQVGIRVLLDNALGENDAPFVIAEEGMPIFYETDRSSASGPVPTQLRFMDDYSNPNVMAYTILDSWSGAKTPDRTAVGHWWNMANTKWDYTADTHMRFTTTANTLNTADTASLYYFNPQGFAQGEEVNMELMYGVGDFAYQRVENGPNVSMSFDSVPELNEAKDGYKNDGLFTLTVKIDNTIDNAQTHTNSTIFLSYEDNLEVVNKPEGSVGKGEVMGIGIINPGEIKTYQWTFRAKEQVYYISSEFIAALNTSLSEVLYRDYVLLPSVEGNLPDFTVDSMEPGEVYFRGTKMVTLKGSFSVETLKGTYGSQWNAYFENISTGEVYQCVKSDVSFIGKNADTLLVRYSDEMALGTYRLVFRFTGGLEGLFDKGSGRIIPEGTLLVSNNPELVTKTYGVLTVMRTGTTGTSYAIVPFETEDEFQKYVEDRNLRSLDCPYEEIMLEIRGAVKYYDDGTDQFYYADPNDDQVIINNILNYGNTDELLYLTEVKENGGSKGIRVHGDGDLGVVGGATFFRWGFEIQFDHGFYYTHSRDKLENVANPQKELMTRDITIDAIAGLGVLQKVAGFLFQLNYGTLTEDWSSLGGAYDPEESKGYAVNFGGKIALNFFELPDMLGGGDDDDSDGGDGGDDGGTGEAVPVPTPEADSGGTEDAQESKKEKSLNSLAGLGASVAIDDIMFGQKKDGSVGFLGINTTVEASLPESFFGDMVSAGPNMTLTINTIDNVYSIEGGVGLKVIECSGILSIKMLPLTEDQKVKIPVPDSMEFSLGGFQSVRIIPPVMSLNALEGGITDIYDTMSGNFEGLPPVTIKLGVGVDLFEILRGGGEIRVSPRSFYAEATLGMANIPAVTLRGIFEAQWASPFYVTGTGQVEILSGAIIGGVNLHLGDGELRGVLFGTVNVPEMIPLMGGMRIAEAEGYLSTGSVGASAKFMGEYVNVVYYWGSDQVDVSSGSEPMYAPGSIYDQMMSASAEGVSPAGGGSAINTDGRVLYGSNINPLAVYENGAQVFGDTGSGASAARGGQGILFGEDGSKTLSFTVNETMAAASTLFIEVPYTGTAPTIGSVTLTVNGQDTALTPATLESGEGNFMINEKRHKVLLSVHNESYAQGQTISVKFASADSVDTENYAVYGAGAVARLKSAATTYGGSGTSFSYTTDTEGLKENSQLQVYLTTDKDALKTLENEGKQTYDQNPDRKNELGTPVNSTPITGSAIKSGTLAIPDTLASGQYYAVYSLTTEGETGFTCLDESNPLNWTNDRQPSPLDSAALIPAGDGAFRVTLGGIARAKNEGVTDLFVELKDQSGNPVSGYEMVRAGIDKANSIYVGGRTVSGVFADVSEAGGSAMAEGLSGGAIAKSYTIQGLTPGESYYVTVTPAKFAPTGAGIEYDENRVYYGESVDSASVQLPQVNTPVLTGMETDSLEERNGTKWLKGDVFTAKYTFNQAVRLSLTVNGSVYDYPNEYKTVWEVSIPLEEGDHSVLYTAKNQGGDTARSDGANKQGVFAFTKDTTAPILFVEGGSVVTASAVAGGLKISGISERGAAVTIHSAEETGVNQASVGTAAAGGAVSAAGAAGARTITADSGGRFTALLPFDFTKRSQPYYLTAADAAGNEGHLQILGVNDDVGAAKSLKIGADQTVGADKIIRVNSGQSVNLNAMAVDAAGKTMNVTDEVKWDVITNPEGASLTEGVFTPRRTGTYAVRASLGGATYLKDAAGTGVEESYGALSDVVQVVVGAGGTIPPDNNSGKGGGGGGSAVSDNAAQIAADLKALTDKLGPENIIKAIEAYPSRQSSVQATESITAVVPVEAVSRENRVVMYHKSPDADTSMISDSDKMLGGQFSFEKLYQDEFKKPVILRFDSSKVGSQTGTSADGSSVSANAAAVGLYRYNSYFDRWELIKEESRQGSVITCALKDLTGQFQFMERADEKSFDDLSLSHWAANFIYRLSSLGVTAGYESGGKLLFRQEDNITRAEYLTLLLKMLKVDVSQYEDYQLEVEDLRDIEDWALPYLKAGFALGIMSGSATRTGVVTNWNQPVTRADAMTLIYNAKKFESPASAQTFADQGQIPAYAAEAVQSLAAVGVISGYSDKTVGPLKNIARGETAAIMVKWMEQVLMSR